VYAAVSIDPRDAGQPEILYVPEQDSLATIVIGGPPVGVWWTSMRANALSQAAEYRTCCRCAQWARGHHVRFGVG
jgi:hypothetical protein